ncbi:MAG: YhjD/YihY/BrkB family envelope integrity protein [Thermoleophilaceae bacterium]
MDPSGRAPGAVASRRISYVHALIDLGRRCVERAAGIEFVDRSMALGSLLFTAAIPLGVVLAAVMPGNSRNDFADALIKRFDLDGDAAQAVHQVFAPPDDVKQSLSILGFLLVIVSALSFTRALQRVYERAWGLPSRGYRGTPAGLVWLAGLIVWVTVFGGIREWLEDLGGPVVSVVVAISFGVTIALFTPYVLLARRLPWRKLVPTAILTAVATTALSVASVVYMPTAIDDSAARYGTIGVAIALVSWLVVIGFALTLSAAIGAVLGERDAGASWAGADDRDSTR